MHNKHGWFSGFFDADGTIEYSLKGINSIPQLTLSVTNKMYVDIIYFLILLVYFDKAQNGYYKFTVQSKINLQSFLD